MTERLTDLLHRAADDLLVPPAPSGEVLRHGRGVRRRRRLAAVGSAAAAVVLASGVTVAAVRDADDPSQRGRDQRTATSSGLTGPVFSVGTTVYLEGGKSSATIQDKAIKSLYYTSAGVVVRHGDNNWSDGGGPMRFSLVSPDGTVHPLPVTFEETVPSTDPDQPYLAYAEKVGGVVDVVVLDVRDGSEVARVPVPDAKSWGGWNAPPVSLDGDLVYVGTDDTQRVVDWRTGEVSTTDTVGPGYPDVHGGHAVGYSDGQQEVVDVADGSVVLAGGKRDSLRLSPDGRYVLVEAGKQSRVVSLSTGSSTPVAVRAGFGVGWSPDDSVFTLEGGRLTTCAPDTGACTATTPSLTVAPDQNESDEDFSDDLRLGGVTYES